MLRYLAYGGTEIANEARTFAYLNNKFDPISNPNGIQGISPRWSTCATSSLCPVLSTDGAGNVLVFERPDGLTSASGDPAPWYDSSVPASAEFLGFLPTQIDGLGSTAERSVTERQGGLGGGFLGSQRLKPREWRVRGILIATSCCGLDYGMRWLAHTLSNDLCDNCETYDLEIRTCCPPSILPPESDIGLWYSLGVGLSQGPAYQQDSADEKPRCCDFAEVEFTLTAQNPWLYDCPRACLDEQFINPPGGPCIPMPDWVCGPGPRFCCDVVPEPEIGNFGIIAPIIEIWTGSYPITGFTVRGFDLAIGQSCPPAAGTQEPCFEFSMSNIPASTRLVIDGSIHKATATTPNGLTCDALRYVDITQGRIFDWPEFVACRRACVCVEFDTWCISEDATIEISLRQRVIT